MQDDAEQMVQENAATPSSSAYDPRYDPLTSRAHPGHGQEYSPTYWVATAGSPPADDGPIKGDVDVDVAIIGSGFTGLACAMVLAEEYGIKATVLEANRTVWGCTSRNGGQGQNASGRLTRSGWIKKWGKQTALALDAELRESFVNFRKLTSEIECDAVDGGHLYVAHRPRKMEFLRHEGQVMRDVYGYDTTIIGQDEYRREYADDHEAFGALHEPDGIGVHPLKLAFGYQRRARAAGATVHPASPAMGIETHGGVHHIRTPGGVVKARAVGFATGGYTSNGLHRSLDSKIMPILSNSLVTRKLTEDEIKAANLRTHTFMTDTRTLRNYFRLLPDNHLQLGSRASITGADAPNPAHMRVLTDAVARKFPPLKDIEIKWSWWGWVDVAHDMMPRIFQPNKNETIYYAVGYGGNGVSFSQHAGRRMADLIAGVKLERPNLPIFKTPLEYPNVFDLVRSRAFVPFRRFGQRFLYHWYHFNDEKA